MSRRATLVIVNADDLGRTPGVNAGIFAAHRDGVVSSATLMVASPAAEEAAAALPDHPELGVGLHVTLTGSAPTLPPGRVPSLVDAQGRLPRRPEDLAGDPGEVLAEVRSQLERFRELTGRLPTHLDSHHHCHRLPVVLEALIALAREHRLPVRNASPAVGRRLRAAGLPTTDAFVERFFGDEARLETLLEILRGIGAGSTEVMCHPAYPDEPLLAESTYAAERARELEVLTDPAARAAIAGGGLRLGHFGHLEASGRRRGSEGAP
jgi:predicted glycoside hydrolase/deacetylase ChbG (UPF0249 family)